MLALAVFIATLGFVIWQPRGLGIGWSAMAGAVVDLALGVIHWRNIPTVWHIVWNATFTFVALIIISLLLDEAGFFRWAALHVARWGRGRGRILLPLIVLLGFAIAAFFANDGAALLLTPIVMAILASLEFPPAAALAFIIATGFVADTTSLPLVISNLVNIVSANYFNIGFTRYAVVMVPVDLVSLVATLAVVGLMYRRTVNRRYAIAALESPSSAIHDPLVFRAAWPILLILLAAYFVTAPLGVPVSFVTIAGAVVLLAIAGRWFAGGSGRIIEIRRVLRGAPWQIVIFSLGMYLVVYGLRNAGLTDYIADALRVFAAHGVWAASLGTGVLAAVLSSIMNNMPSVLVGALAIGQLGHLAPRIHDAMVYANVIGCDLGPKFTPIGSLATLLWLHVLSRKGTRITWGQYMRIGLAITPPVLLATLAALALWLPVVGAVSHG
ncbi:arsenic transporter [Acidiphilium acidophilum]|uniref:arsenic transporter n=1 Tax=Acidiphilium acidophilum TaxID=76588 RepID=UPI002E8E6313|nr:arsenic transporter [Acidiphilium acidophilum]